ncbi:hypothetical protein CGMCC3_g15878 [Colletotrichum fructicola]|nr:uncharacterized protein CGMCC3_g15878 [Colletotrichum fructicola]KAE9568015.1 hypothetical protein CGMCC3_g15878 [Colletotrichum fructicola]
MNIDNKNNTNQGGQYFERIEEADIEDHLDRIAMASHSQEIVIMLQTQLIWVLEQRIMYYESEGNLGGPDQGNYMYHFE